MMDHAIRTCWARKKLERARTHLAELEHAGAAWLDPLTHPLDIVLSDDGWKIEAVREFKELPPLEDWSLIVGDCAHNLRTALDVFVWANSTLLSEADRKRVAFPILDRVDDEEDDDDELPHRLENQAKKVRNRVKPKVEGLPEPLRSRVVGNMRWASLRNEGDLVWHQRLPLVKELDDIDKHRLSLELAARQNSATWGVKAMDAEGVPVKVNVSWSTHGKTPIRVGERMVIASGAPEQRVARVGGTANVALGLRVRLFDLNLDVQESLEVFIGDVEGLLDVLDAAE